MEEGLTLQYRAGKSDLQLRYQDVTSEASQQKARLHVELKGRQGSVEASCSADGVQTEAGGLEGTLLATSGMEVEVVSSEGVVLPAAEKLRPGATWKNRLAVKLTPPDSVKLPAGMRPVISTAFEKEATVVGEESVTVAAGTFQALKVKNRTTAKASPSSPPRSVDSLLWFVKGVGLVKISTGSATDLELLKVERSPSPSTAKAPRPTAR